MWREMRYNHKDWDDDDDERIEEAYNQGCKDGYAKAMKEQYGERGGHYGGRYGERRAWYAEEREPEFGERRYRRM